MRIITYTTFADITNVKSIVLGYESFWSKKESITFARVDETFPSNEPYLRVNVPPTQPPFPIPPLAPFWSPSALALVWPAFGHLWPPFALIWPPGSTSPPFGVQKWPYAGEVSNPIYQKLVPLGRISLRGYFFSDNVWVLFYFEGTEVWWVF